MMERRDFLQQTVATSASLILAAATSRAATAKENAAQRLECDAFVYGSTPGGLAAAIQAAREGCRVVMACPKRHPGGMTASGLCTTDAVRREMFGGLVIEFIDRVREDYRRELGENSPEWPLIHDGWFYEPSVAERVFERLLEAESERLTFLRAHHLVSAETADGRVNEVVLQTPAGEEIRLTANTFIDGTYEGDLAAAAGVPYRVGREGRDELGESLAGIHYMNWKTGEQIQTPDTGEPSPAIQAFCARSIFTDDPEKLVPLEKPDTYEQHLPDLLPLLDDFSSGRVKRCSLGSKLARRKYQLNGSIDRLTSINCPGISWTWPEAERHHRERLEKFHVDHAASYAWFLQNDPRVPDDIRALWKKAGRHADEFTDNDHWPWQIYVRQGRRIDGRARVTQHNFIVDPKTGRTPKIEHPIAIGEHSFDVHPCHDRRFAVDGWMEGVLWYPKKAFGPAQPGQVPYGAMLPEKLENLLVPVALSSTHIAMSVLRMEPLWMTTGQIAGLAAAEAKDSGVAVANLDPDPLPAKLKIKIDPYA
ncbi:MAG: FAD-dependent oxidoreductase [Verrucomicrobiae bacterium]|nr:FAD-dependent oxidoreductase [Verrucomicrobiae bacterium]